MNKNEQIFLARYQNLNDEQRKAVDTLEGPVMVIAGPGTGKTEILSLRIANLLRSEHQVKPHEILCLTYTDEGSIAMRKRLLQIIGEEAHRVNIFTFHAFCNTVIQNNAEYFGMRELQAISDLERVEIIHDILDNLPTDNVLRRMKGDLYYDGKNLARLFDMMKREYWTSELVTNAVDQYIESLPEREEFLYKRNSKGNKKGDPKVADIRKETIKMQRTRAAADLFTEYQQRMETSGRYDFTDMILWVIDAFKNNEDFLRNYQERFQYVLVDEFQDTSGAQNELLRMLMDYWDTPNLFTVGDDDQSIFEFQGARQKNIVDVYQRYYKEDDNQNIKVIVLTKNYRSSQPILDQATKLINHNNERLINSLKGLNLDKNIRSAADRFEQDENPEPVIKCYFNPTHEDVDIALQIESLQKQGVNLGNVAILYAQHKQAANLINLLERKKIPFWVKNPANILNEPLVLQLLNLFRYLKTEQAKPHSGEALLFQLMHVPYFGIPPTEIAALSLEMQQKGAKYKQYRNLLLDPMTMAGWGLQSVKELNDLGKAIEKWLSESTVLNIAMLLEKVVYDLGILAYILKSEQQFWEMQVLNSFFQFVKEECSRKPRLTLAEFLKVIDDMNTASIEIPIQKVIKQEDGVRFYTAFGAKGHEFEYVFVLGSNHKYWEGKSAANSGFSLPDTLTQTSSSSDASPTEETMRRVFYVALTRAKKYLQVSYYNNDEKGKAVEASKFVQEINPEGYLVAEKAQAAVEPEVLMQELSVYMQPAPMPNIALAKQELIERRLEGFALSASTLNSYLKCQVAFYFEQILRVPTAKNDSLAFGTAIHFALEKMFKKMKEHPQHEFPELSDVITDFEKMMWIEQDAFTQVQYDRRKEFGTAILSEYYEHYIHSFNKAVSVELNFNNIQVSGVPIKGKIDKIEFTGNDCIVVDYKTGNADRTISTELAPPNEKNPDGGNYWRQMVFYKILLEASPIARENNWNMTSGLFDFIEKSEKKDSFVQQIVPISPSDVATVKAQIKDSYARIMNHEFSTGCNEEKCQWCDFVKTNKLNLPETTEKAIL